MFRATLMSSGLSFLVFLVAQIVNLNRQAWLGIEPGYAPHNFAFNLSFYGPVMLLALLLCVASIILYVAGIRRSKRDKQRIPIKAYLTILPSLPAFLWVILLAIWIGHMVSRS
jgi:hypothetical protein